jgi:hypothetical protein
MHRISGRETGRRADVAREGTFEPDRYRNLFSSQTQSLAESKTGYRQQVYPLVTMSKVESLSENLKNRG